MRTLLVLSLVCLFASTADAWPRRRIFRRPVARPVARTAVARPAAPNTSGMTLQQVAIARVQRMAQIGHSGHLARSSGYSFEGTGAASHRDMLSTCALTRTGSADVDAYLPGSVTAVAYNNGRWYGVRVYQ